MWERLLLSEVNLTFQRAFEIAQGLESAVQNLKTLLPSKEIHKVEKTVSTRISVGRVIVGPSLMGRDWLAVFRLNWKEIYYIENCSIQSVLQSTCRTSFL